MEPQPALPSVPLLYPNSTIVCIAPGPSLLRNDCELVRKAGLPAITVNGAWRYAEWAPVRFAADGYWWAQHVAAHEDYRGLMYTLEHGAPEKVTRLGYNSSITLSMVPTALATGGHSGYAAVNLAALLGARTILLLGYDMMPAASGAHHAGGDQYGQKHPRYELWLPRYADLRKALAHVNVTILNCSRNTAITSIIRVSLQSAIEEALGAQA